MIIIRKVRIIISGFFGYGIKETRSIFEQKVVETIYNNIEPKPIVDIVFQNVSDKDIAIIKVAKGNEQPYYIKKQGPEEGCYIRYGSTDQKPTKAKKKKCYTIKEMKPLLVKYMNKVIFFLTIKFII